MERLAAQVGQLLWVGFDGLEASPALLARVRAGDLGAAVLFRRNVKDLVQVAALNASLHAAAPADAPLTIAVDQEGGSVQRLRAPATEWPPVLRLSEHGARAAALAERFGRALGDELAATGFDLDFAPVLDVHTNPANPVIGKRAFATTPERVIELAGAFARGLAAAGVLSCGKHFPGHGDTSTDSHLDLPRVDHDLARLRAIELAPFRALSHLPSFMTAHVIFAALDATLPATLSPPVLALLRGELGYRGVVISDDLEMKAIADHFGLEDALERGLRAGCDAFLICHTEALQVRALEFLTKLAEKDSTVRARVAESAARILAMKRAHRPVRPSLSFPVAAHQALAKDIGDLGVLVDPTERF